LCGFDLNSVGTRLLGRDGELQQQRDRIVFQSWCFIVIVGTFYDHE
jgi:hypothetical protein